MQQTHNQPQNYVKMERLFFASSFFFAFIHEENNNKATLRIIIMHSLAYLICRVVNQKCVE